MRRHHHRNWPDNCCESCMTTAMMSGMSSGRDFNSSHMVMLASDCWAEKKNVGVEIAAARNNPIQESHLQVAFLRCRPRFDSTPWVAAALQNKSEINRFFLKKFEDRFISLFLFLNYKFAIVLRVTPGCARAPTLAHRSKIPKRTPTKRKGL